MENNILKMSEGCRTLKNEKNFWNEAEAEVLLADKLDEIYASLSSDERGWIDFEDIISRASLEDIPNLHTYDSLEEAKEAIEDYASLLIARDIEDMQQKQERIQEAEEDWQEQFDELNEKREGLILEIQEAEDDESRESLGTRLCLINEEIAYFDFKKAEWVASRAQ